MPNKMVTECRTCAQHGKGPTPQFLVVIEFLDELLDDRRRMLGKAGEGGQSKVRIRSNAKIVDEVAAKP
jgi:hypothetical protein